MANLVGEDALVATSGLVFQTLRADVRFSEFIVLTNFSELAAHVRRFLQGAFGGNEWPELRVNVEFLRGYDNLADALVDVLNQPMPLGADIMSEAFNLLATDMADDGRVLLILERIGSLILELPEVCKTGEGIRVKQSEDVQERVKYIPLDATSPDWPVDDGAFDIVLMSYISGSVPEPIIGALYANAFKALKPKGRLLVHALMMNDALDGHES